MVVKPAYGRIYKSAAEVKAAWKDNRDFVILDMHSGPGLYVNRADALKVRTVQGVEIRYGARLEKALYFPASKL